MIDADGTLLGVTRMIHITEYACFHEQGYYTPGDKGAPVYRTQAGRVGVAICYDRHFPEYMRALALNGADLVFVPQAGSVGEWPEGLYEGEMRVAAFQNGYCVALCNRVGREDCLEFAGESFVCDADGNVIARAPLGQRRHAARRAWIWPATSSRTHGDYSCATGVRSFTPTGWLGIAEPDRG